MLQNRNTCVNKDKVAELVPAYNPLTNGQCAMVVRCVTLTTIKNSELQGTSFCIFNFNHYFIAGALTLVSGIVPILTLHLLKLIKVRLAVNDGRTNT